MVVSSALADETQLYEKPHGVIRVHCAFILRFRSRAGHIREYIYNANFNEFCSRRFGHWANYSTLSYYFALFSAPTGTVDASLFVFAGAYATNTATVGRINGGQPQVPGHEPGNFVSLLVRGWSANIGSNHSSVTDYLANPTFDAWYGESQIATVFVGGGAVPIPFIFGSQFGQIPGFTLEMHTIPEPSSGTLAGLGCLGLWLWRRRSH